MMNPQTIFDQRRGMRRLIARELGIYPSAVSQWGRVPAERVLDVERVTGIPRYELRPDLYPDAHTAPLRSLPAADVDPGGG